MSIDIPDQVTRSPREIMRDMFQIQGVHLDPDDIDPAVERMVNSIRPATARSSSKEYDCFISYRVESEKHVAEKIYLALKAEGKKPFLDKKCLKDGEAWKDGFVRGLLNSRKFISLISAKALAPCRAKTRDHSHDNVLLEMQIALKIKEETGNSSFILPVLVGESNNGALTKFAGFDVSQYSDTVQSQRDTMKPWWVSPPRREDGQRIAFFTKDFTENVLKGKWYPSRDPPDSIYGEALKVEGGSFSWDLRDADLDRMFAGKY